ncbi:MAG: hypothetical protein H0W25_13710 [Acidimicrobiia bacterium]|nr:hypothetical protein [Acidimicrobiia bacterium]
MADQQVHITVSGRTYGSWAEVPAEQKRLLLGTFALADADRDGTPDVFQRKALGRPSTRMITETTFAATVDGRTYTSAADLPRPLRTQLRRSLAADDAAAAAAADFSPLSERTTRRGALVALSVLVVLLAIALAVALS